jgi:hypothetical protein
MNYIENPQTEPILTSKTQKFHIKKMINSRYNNLYSLKECLNISLLK